MLPAAVSGSVSHHKVSILTSPGGLVLQTLPLIGVAAKCVSILTSPGGLVLPAPRSRRRFRHQVSILTSPGGLVLRRRRPQQQQREKFQSSPAPEGWCYIAAAVRYFNVSRFQSSPAPEGWCYQGAALERVAGVGFNPHQPRRAGATVNFLRKHAGRLTVLYPSGKPHAIVSEARTLRTSWENSQRLRFARRLSVYFINLHSQRHWQNRKPQK